MELIKNSLDRDVPVSYKGRDLVPYRGHKPMHRGSKVVSLEEAIKRVGLKDGMTVSFHHQLRQGDNVLNTVMAAVAKMGIKNLRLAPTAMFPVNEPVVDHIKNGVINRIEGSMNGPVGDFVCHNPDALIEPGILRSHGRRGAAIKSGELPIDVAFIAASESDEHGNCNGIWGESAFGPMAYSYVDSIYAKKVVIVTDNIQKYPIVWQDITEDKVDYVVQVDSIGDPDKIVTGSLSITTDPMRLKIARYAADLVDAAGLIKDGLNFQSGAGGMSLAATKDVGDLLEERDVVANMVIGGTTKFVFDIYEAGRVRMVHVGQAFDKATLEFCRTHEMGKEWAPMNIPHYASPISGSRGVDHLDVVFLGGTEVDVNFNVNVNTHSDGRLLHGIGGHQDTAAGAWLTIVLTPILRKTNPIIRDRVTTVTTPGQVVDAIATDRGVAINPRRKDLLELVKGSDLPVVPIEELRDMAYEEVGGAPAPPDIDKSKVAAYIHWLDGSVRCV